MSRPTLPPKLAEAVRRVVDEAPPLTQAQRTELAALIRGGAGS